MSMMPDLTPTCAHPKSMHGTNDRDSCGQPARFLGYGLYGDLPMYLCARHAAGWTRSLAKKNTGSAGVARHRGRIERITKIAP